MKIIKIILLSLVAIYLIFNLAGCFTFRMGEKKRNRFFEDAHPAVRFGSTKNSPSGNQGIFFAETTNESAENYLLFIHGSPGSGSNFYSFLKDTSLTKVAQIGSIDRPGFGYSRFGVAEPSLKKQAERIETLLQKHKNQRIILCGHSLGAPVAVQMALLFPDLIEGIFILAGSVDPILEPKEPWRKPMDHPLLSWLLPKSFRVSNREIIPLKKHLETMSLEWKNLRCKVYVLQGGKDKLVHPGNANFVASKVPLNQQTIILIEDENHFIPFTNPELLTQHILKFLNQYGKE